MNGASVLRAKQIAMIVSVLCSGCVATPEELCRRELPEFREKISAAQIAIKKELDSSQGRQLASLETEVKRIDLTDWTPLESLARDSREHWKAWSAARLREVQALGDRLERSSKTSDAHRALSGMADRLVHIYGYAELGDTKKLLSSVEAMSVSWEIERGRFCKLPTLPAHLE